MLTRFRGKEKFRKADFQESNEDLNLPCCGWYHVYTFMAAPPADGKPVEEEIWLDEACREEQLALVLIDIGAFQNSPLSREALLHIGQILAFFHQIGKMVILRFVYDREGRGMQKEPFAIAMVKRHMEQAGEAIRPWLEDILVMQGIFVGNWGEMHGSKFLDDVSLWELTDMLLSVTKGRCFLAVRTPAQWRRIMANPKAGPELERRLALYNDGIFGSPTDLGTYGTQSRAEAGETGSWSPGEELEWQSRFLDAVPNGGEILSCEPFQSYEQAAVQLGDMHVSYLNRIYHPDQLDCWRKETVQDQGCWQGVSGYDYIGRHLGYRFWVRDVAEKKRRELRITVVNCGFGNLCEEADCFLVTDNGTGTESCKRLDTDAREWMRGQETVLTIQLSPEETGPGSRVYLMLKRRSDGRILRFANRDSGERVLLGEYRA